MPKITIAIDGPASSGKGTLAKGVAKRLGYQYIDTGAMYRAVAYLAQDAGIDWSDVNGLSTLAHGLFFRFNWNGDTLDIFVDGVDLTSVIRSESIGVGASKVSVHMPVRDALLQLQRNFGKAGGVVVDGRDIGTVVLPMAQLKVYLDADVNIRAKRRHDEHLLRGEDSSFERVLAALKARDHQDMTREISPLKRAADAVVLDSTNLSIEEAMEVVVTLAKTRCANISRYTS